jgi:hypothetical protein
MLLSSVYLLVVVQQNSEVSEGFMSYPVYISTKKIFNFGFLWHYIYCLPSKLAVKDNVPSKTKLSF